MSKLSLKILTINVLLFSFLPFAIKAQIELDFKSAKFNRKKTVLVVPFDPRIYNNDATSLILKNDKMTHDELMQYFRYQFNLQLVNSLIDSCNVVSLFTDNTRVDQQDIDNLYSIISYEWKIAQPNRPENPESQKKKNYFERKKEEKEQQKRKQELENSRTRIQNGEIVVKPVRKDDHYLHIVFHQTEVLEEIARRRQIDYFIFINQFEIKGIYGDPYIAGNPKAERIFNVHFSIYNYKGNFIHGSYGQTKIPFNLDDKDEIVRNYFPEVIRQIIFNLRFN
jgi:hypothetical protein